LTGKYAQVNASVGKCLVTSKLSYLPKLPLTACLYFPRLTHH
jgi:hypothetical protein